MSTETRALHTLAQRLQNVEFEEVCLEEAEEEDAAEGWAALAKALHLCPGFESVQVSRRVMLLADRRELRTIWDALGTYTGVYWGGFWWVLGVEEYQDDDGVVRFQPDFNYSWSYTKDMSQRRTMRRPGQSLTKFWT